MYQSTKDYKDRQYIERLNSYHNVRPNRGRNQRGPWNSGCPLPVFETERTVPHDCREQNLRVHKLKNPREQEFDVKKGVHKNEHSTNMRSQMSTTPTQTLPYAPNRSSYYQRTKTKIGYDEHLKKGNFSQPDVVRTQRNHQFNREGEGENMSERISRAREKLFSVDNFPKPKQKYCVRNQCHKSVPVYITNKSQIPIEPTQPLLNIAERESTFKSTRTEYNLDKHLQNQNKGRNPLPKSTFSSHENYQKEYKKDIESDVSERKDISVTSKENLTNQQQEGNRENSFLHQTELQSTATGHCKSDQKAPESLKRKRQNDYLRGIPNVGNTCYANSILQENSVSKMLLDLIEKINYDESPSSYYSHMFAGDVSFLLRTIFQQDTSFRLGGQNDSHSFLLTLFECIEAEGGIKALELFEGYSTNDFEYQCEHKDAASEQRFTSLLIPIPDDCDRNKTLKRGLELLMGETFEEGLLQCRKCMKETKTLRRLRFLKLPQILILQLGTFKEVKGYGGRMELRKHHSSLKYPDIFQMPLSPDSASKSCIGYSLYGVVSHAGSLHGGHYTADVKRGSQWYHCSDSSVTKTRNPVESYGTGACILFYRRK